MRRDAAGCSSGRCGVSAGAPASPSPPGAPGSGDGRRRGRRVRARRTAAAGACGSPSSGPPAPRPGRPAPPPPRSSPRAGSRASARERCGRAQRKASPSSSSSSSSSSSAASAAAPWGSRAPPRHAAPRRPLPWRTPPSPAPPAPPAGAWPPTRGLQSRVGVGGSPHAHPPAAAHRRLCSICARCSRGRRDAGHVRGPSARHSALTQADPPCQHAPRGGDETPHASNSASTRRPAPARTARESQPAGARGWRGEGLNPTLTLA